MDFKEIEKTLKEIQELKRLEEEAAEARAELEHQIKALMDDQHIDTLSAGAFRATYKPILQSRFDSKAFRADHADLAQQYTKQAEFRRFRIA